MQEFLKTAIQRGASDVHMSANIGVTYRIHGRLIVESEPLSREAIEAFAQSIMNPLQWERFHNSGDEDLALSVTDVGRFRINVYRQRGQVSLAIRVVPQVPPELDALGLPPSIKAFADKKHGLVLVTGPAGSGKSTTLAAIINHINDTKECRIITLEDPIEYVHEHKRAVIEQRQVGEDTVDFATGLRACLRQDPDVVLLGEMRDVETIRTAITAAETGHLVFATMHTATAVDTVDRIIDVYPATQQSQIRVQLSTVLQGVITQRLVVGNTLPRVPIVEILVNTPAVGNLIRSGKTHQIKSLQQTGRTHGMQTMEMHCEDLIAAGKVTSLAFSEIT